jgi:cytochrome bd ubiquinol oxidase subunit I
MDLDPLLVSRLQFAFTIIFHIIFPAFTIGLSAYIATLCVMWMRTGKKHYRELARFWTKIFAAAFAMGVVSGIVLSYQFGTNWSRYSTVLGNIVGPMIGYEVEAAFFLEATFLGVLLFGWDRMPPWLHTLAALAVAGGTLLSAFWILSANSWMQTPAGYEMRDGIAFPIDWLTIVFNPSFPYRLAHMVTAAYLTTSFVVLAVGARFILAGTHLEHGRTMVRMAVGFAAVVAPLQLFIGDRHGLNTLEHQPLKIAAMEAHWDGSRPGELVLFAWPDESAEVNRFAVTIPHGACGARRASHGRVHPGSGAVFRHSRASWTRGFDPVCQYPRDRRMVQRGCACGAQNGGAACSVGRAGAKCADRQIGKRRRYPHLRPRRDGSRGRQTA